MGFERWWRAGISIDADEVANAAAPGLTTSGLQLDGGHKYGDRIFPEKQSFMLADNPKV